MRTIHKNIGNEFIFEDNNLSVRSLFSANKIWLTLNDISDIYSISKDELKFKISEIIFNSELEINESIKRVYNDKTRRYETFYSLDLLLILGYKSKKYKETKFLVHTNRMIKEYAWFKKYRLSSFVSTPIIKNIVNFFDPVMHII